MLPIPFSTCPFLSTFRVTKPPHPPPPSEGGGGHLGTSAWRCMYGYNAKRKGVGEAREGNKEHCPTFRTRFHLVPCCPFSHSFAFPSTLRGGEGGGHGRLACTSASLPSPATMRWSRPSREGRREQPQLPACKGNQIKEAQKMEADDTHTRTVSPEALH